MSLLLVLIMAGFTGLIAGYVGSLMITKRMALAGGSLGHLTIPGVTIALIYGFDVSIGALLFLGLGIFFIWFFKQKSGLSMELLTAVVFATSMAIAFLFISEEQVIPALIGDTSGLTINHVLITVITSMIVLFVINKIYSKMILINISEDLAKAERINVSKYNFIYLLCVAITIALGVRVVGGLMTAAIVAIPAATSKLVSKNLIVYSYFSAFIGSSACILGVITANYSGLAGGPLIIIFNGLFFLISLVFKTSL